MDRPDVTKPGVTIMRGNALRLDLPDNFVDLVVTSPPYFGLRSYQDGGEHYDGQIGAEATPAEFVDALIAATREMVRVVKPSGSIWVNLGDKYVADNRGSASDVKRGEAKHAPAGPAGYVGQGIMPRKSLMGIPWRYAIRCIDELGLILRAEVIWSKPNGLPESVTDRVRRSHEQWFHFTLEPRYYSAVDEVREEHAQRSIDQQRIDEKAGLGKRAGFRGDAPGNTRERSYTALSPLGKLPGSVWTIPTEPLRVPDHLGIDHFAAFPTEWPRRIITGWSPAGVCVECGEGRRPVVGKAAWWEEYRREHNMGDFTKRDGAAGQGAYRAENNVRIPQGPKAEIRGYACACPEPTAPTTPGVVLDPFGGTGTTALVAHALGRHGISNDMSADYCRLARWRTSDPKQQAKAARKPYTPPAEQIDGQMALIDVEESA